MYEYDQFDNRENGLREEISEIVGKRITGIVAKKQGSALAHKFSSSLMTTLISSFMPLQQGRSSGIAVAIKGD